MSLITHIRPGERDESRDLELAMACRSALEKAYPNHPWGVEFSGHSLVVKHAMINNVMILALMRVRGMRLTPKDGFGMRLPHEKIGTVHQAQESAVKAAGTMLEMFGMPREPMQEHHLPQIPVAMLREIAATRQLRGWR